VEPLVSLAIQGRMLIGIGMGNTIGFKRETPAGWV
jgi:hypothetical protein